MGRCARLAWEHGVEHFDGSAGARPGISTAHLLLGVLTQQECAGGLILRRLGLDPALAVSVTEFELLHGRLGKESTQSVMHFWGRPLTQQARDAMECALAEAEKFHATYPIGTEHMLLGMLALAESSGCRTLKYFGVDYEAAQAARADIWDLLQLTE